MINIHLTPNYIFQRQLCFNNKQILFRRYILFVYIEQITAHSYISTFIICTKSTIFLKHWYKREYKNKIYNIHSVIVVINNILIWNVHSALRTLFLIPIVIIMKKLNKWFDYILLWWFVQLCLYKTTVLNLLIKIKKKNKS